MVKLQKYDAEFRETLDGIKVLLEKHEYDEGDLVMHRKHVMDCYKEFNDEVFKMAEVVKKQEQRLKEHAASAAKKAVAVVSGAAKSLIEDEKIKCKDIKSEADIISGRLTSKLEGFKTRVMHSPSKGSPRAGSASAAPSMEKETLAQYNEAMAAARDGKGKAEARAASALKAARIAGNSMMMVSDAVELCRDSVVAPRWSEDEWLGYFRLPEAAVSDLAAVTGAWGLKSSPIAEYAWEIVTGSLDGDELGDELPKWGRHNFLRLADAALT